MSSHLFLRSLVGSSVCPDRASNAQPRCAGTVLQPTGPPGQAPSLLSDRLSCLHRRSAPRRCLSSVSLPCLSLSFCLSQGFFHSLSLISLLLCLPPPLPAPPHILSCLWGTGNLGDQRDTRRLSCCCLEIMHGGGAGAGGGWGSPARHTQRDRGIVSLLGASTPPSADGACDPPLSQGWRKNEIKHPGQSRLSKTR